MAVEAFVAREETRGSILDALRDRNLARLQGAIELGGVAAAVAHYTETPTPDVLIVEFDVGKDEMMAGLENLSGVCDPGTRVVVIGTENDVELYRSLIRMGISDYLPAPLTARQIFDAVYALVADPNAQKAGKVFAFMGVRGGVGSSTIAHNVAWSLADVRALDVALLDLDLQFGTAALAFNLEARQGVYECLSQPERLDEQLLNRYLVPYGDHLRVLGTSGSLNLPDAIDAPPLEKLVDLIARKFPFVVVDLPTRWTDWTRDTIMSADEIIVTATLDLVALRDAQGLLRHIDEGRGAERAAKLVLNQAGRGRKTELNEKDFEDAIGRKPMLTVDYDPILFGTASNNGQPVAEVNARSKIAATMRQMAETLSGTQKAGKGRGKGKLLNLLKRK